MEMEFLSALNYNIYVKYENFKIWTDQCEAWWAKYSQPLPLLNNTTSKKRPSSSSLDYHYTPKKRHIIEEAYYPILSWSSSLSAISIANQQFSLPHNKY